MNYGGVKQGRLHHFTYCLSVLVLAMTFVSCGEDRTYQYDEITRGNHRIVELMQDYYLWADEMNTDIDWKGYFGNGDTFFKKLIAIKDDWSYCTIDSVVEDKFARGYFNHLNSYGMDFDVIADPTGATSRTFARVLFVATDSEADKAGITRGDFISFIGQARVSNSNVKYLVSGDTVNLTINHLAYDVEEELLYWEDTVDVVMGKSGHLEDYPYFVNEVFDFQSRRVAYLMDTRLIRGPYETDPSSVKYRDDMDSIFATYKALGVNELIVDLRFCNHGEMDMAQRLASYIAASKHNGEVFATTAWRDDLSANNTTNNYDLSLTNGNALELDRVVFITGGYTTGPAEWMIHSLQHTMGTGNVILIGEWTAGQNVMTVPVATDFHMTLYPVVANVGDATGDNDYPKGIEPTFLNNESSYVYLYEYGSLDEILLLDALYTLFNLGED
jgi:C-terminal processing protease CtpA/Prc